MTQQDHQNPERIKVLITHEMRVIREALALLLQKSPAFTVITRPWQKGESKEKREDCAVNITLTLAELDIDTIEDKIQKIKDKYTDTRVVIIGVSGTEQERLEHIEAGASGYVSPGSSPEHLIETIQKVHRSEATCPPDILARLVERVASLRAQLKITQENQLSNLTRRELEVLQLVADGMSNKEIAVYLNLEIQTAKNHVHSILAKLQVHNRREAAAFTQKLGLGIESH